ncbi:hypothetical protein RF11_00797 [Thelohanellus kitauei]|uniref:Uncharacterized protein n=1 Tax=Thelohanellus kitauei TaxID=669202 RepID=A0A0C2MW13_THEKT|nr:hypothetical protein RF11_00797 [Thelohanellus kitauei]
MSDNESDCETRKKRVFKKEWEKLYPIKEVKSDIYAFYCLICKKTLSCADYGQKSVKGHCKSVVHREIVRSHTLVPNIPSLSAIHPPELSMNVPPMTFNPRMVNLNSSNKILDKKIPSSTQETPNVSIPHIQPKIVKTSNPQTKEKKFDIYTLDENLKQMALIEKYKFAYGLVRKMESDFKLAMGPTSFRMPQRIMDGIFINY